MERHGHLAARCRGAPASAGDERGDDRPRACGTPKDDGRRRRRRTHTADDPAERSDADLRRLGRSAARVRRGGSGRAQRADGRDGSFVQTLVLTDIATGWTECAPLLVREQTLLIEVLTELRKLLPFELLGLRHRQRHRVHERDGAGLLLRREKITFTRCRPYRKNDQAWVEQKNGAVVRRIVGYRRLEGFEAARGAGGALCGGAAVRELLPALVQAGGEAARRGPRPQALPPAGHALPAAAGGPANARGGPRRGSRRSSRRWTRFAFCGRYGRPSSGWSTSPTRPARAAEPPPSLETFLSALRTAWQTGEVRPTAQPKPKPKRGRRRPDPLAAVTRAAARLVRRGAVADEPRAPRQAAERSIPDRYPDGLLRTVQRRLKTWRSEHALSLVFAGLGTRAIPRNKGVLAP